MKIKKLFKGRLNPIYMKWEFWRQCSKSRETAIKTRNKIVQKRGYTVVDRTLKRRMKRYCRSAFGSASYWPWLATYTEINGGYKEGWIPCELLAHRVLSGLNNKDLSSISLLKTLTYQLFKDMAIRPVLIIVGWQLYDPDFNPVTMEEGRKKLASCQAEVVIKKDGGYGGYDVHFVHSKDMLLEDYVGRADYVIEPVVKQHESLQSLHPESVNTIRILTYLNAQSEVEVKFIRLKMGVNGSRINNAVQGGRSVYVDTSGRVISDAYLDKSHETETNHPDTGICYRDIVVPSIGQAIDLCKDAHLLYPYVAIIGWDVYIDPDANPVIMEWNALHPTLCMHEALTGPLFDLDELKNRLGL